MPKKKKTFSVFQIKDDGTTGYFLDLKHADSASEAIEEVAETFDTEGQTDLHGQPSKLHGIPEDQLVATEVNEVIPIESVRTPWWRR